MLNNIKICCTVTKYRKSPNSCPEYRVFKLNCQRGSIFNVPPLSFHAMSANVHILISFFFLMSKPPLLSLTFKAKKAE